MEAGVYPDLTFEQYRNVPAVNASRLKHLMTSPLHHQYRQHNDESSSWLTKGHAVHCATLEPEHFGERFVVYPGKVRRGKAWDDFQAEHEGRIILSAGEHTAAVNAAAAVMAHPVANSVIDQAEHQEVTVIWRHLASGRLCKARLDFVGKSALGDLKTTSAFGPGRFESSAMRYHYPMQLAFYADAWTAATGEVPPVKIVAVDSNAPHDVAVYDLSEEVLSYGREQYEAALDVLTQCEESGIWPGAAPDEIPFRLPAWAVSQQDDRIFGSIAFDELDGAA